VLFSAVTISIGRGGRSPGISAGSFDWMPALFGVDRGSNVPSQPATEVKARPRPAEQLSSELVTGPSPLFGLGLLFFLCDRDGNFMLSPAEMANAPAMLRTLDRDKDKDVGPNETNSLLLALLDRNRDGIISSAEMDRSTAVLRGLDANQDGTLILAEVFATKAR